MNHRLKILLSSLLAIIIVLGFTLPANPPTGNWYQQFLPNINNRPVSDMIFTDSLTGYIVTPYVANDTAYVLKTMNGGDSWNIVFRQPSNTVGGFNRIQFLNQSTGFACGNFLWKTTNAGLNWFNVNTSGIFPMNMYVIDTSTIWLIDSDGLVGGVFFTSNGGANWTPQLALGSLNPDHIYMYNARIGFVSRVNSGAPYTRRTTNGGQNWTVVVNNEAFTDMHFVDSLTGWKANFFTIEKTTNGGVNWLNQVIPFGGILTTSGIQKISVINRDTIFGAGGLAFYGGGQNRGIIYRTTNGGDNWLFQIPDTTIHLLAYGHIEFTSKYCGWAYTISGGVHTITGGDPVWLTGIKQISNEVPGDFRLYQNYPNPFNPSTNIKYQIINNNSNVQLIVFDIQGKEIVSLVNQKQNAGTYQVDFSGYGYSSGVYFYKIIIEAGKGVFTDTKKMILVK